MQKKLQTQLITILTCISGSSIPAIAQDVTGMSFGIPNSSPAAFWPRGMSMESLSPSVLYPNGPQFGLSNTSGGFGMAGSGPISGVGMTQRSVSPLIQSEMSQTYGFNRHLGDAFRAESVRGSANFAAVLSGRSARDLAPSLTDSPDFSYSRVQTTSTQYAMPSTDSILRDRANTTESILQGNRN